MRTYSWTPLPQEHTQLLPSGLKHHPLGTALELSWDDPISSEESMPLISISRIIYSGDPGSATDFLEPSSWELDPNNPIYQSPNQSTTELLFFVLEAPTTSHSIKGSYFAQAGLYMISVHELSWSTSSTETISLGSGVLAGPGTNFLFWVN